jgi:hypothetical protein
MQSNKRLKPSHIGQLVALTEVEHEQADKGRQRRHVGQLPATAEVENVQTDERGKIVYAGPITQTQVAQADCDERRERPYITQVGIALQAQ